jgi:hypothetical protein
MYELVTKNEKVAVSTVDIIEKDWWRRPKVEYVLFIINKYLKSKETVVFDDLGDKNKFDFLIKKLDLLVNEDFFVKLNYNRVSEIIWSLTLFALIISLFEDMTLLSLTKKLFFNTEALKEDERKLNYLLEELMNQLMNEGTRHSTFEPSYGFRKNKTCEMNEILYKFKYYELVIGSFEDVCENHKQFKKNKPEFISDEIAPCTAGLVAYLLKGLSRARQVVGDYEERRFNI